MKRKIITAILAITVVFSAASCGSAENKSSNTQEATVSDTQNSTERVSEAAGNTQSEEMTATVNDGENVPGSGASKSDTSDAAASSSADSKDTDSTVKKNCSDSKSSTKNSTSTAVNHNSTQSTGASTAKTDSGKKSTQSSGASNQTKPASAAGSSSGTANKPAAHTHTWVKYVANTINHPEQGHYETKVVKAAYDEPKYEEHNVCNKCGYDMGTDDWNVLNHENICDGSYSCIPVQVGTIHHDAVTEQVYVVDQAAYTENVYGERCSGCGATK